MTAPTKIETFEQFWDFYVGQHRKKTTRLFHFVGTTAAIGCVAGALLTKRRWLLLVAPLAGYGPAWFSHFFIEKNKPATFTYPLWSLQADFVMWWKTLSGQMQAEVERVLRQEAEKAQQESSEPAEREHVSTQSEAIN